MSDEETIEFKGESNASTTFPMQCSALRKNGYVMIKNRPCKIMEMSTSKTGKHGHAKVHLVGIDIFNQKRYEDLCPSTHNIDVPNVSRLEYVLLDISDDGFVTLMDSEGTNREDLKLPFSNVELTQKIKEGFEKGEEVIITVIKAVGEEAIIQSKVGAS